MTIFAIWHQTRSLASGARSSNAAGNWPTNFGKEGFVIANYSTNLPANLAFSVTGATAKTWAADTKDRRALIKPGRVLFEMGGVTPEIAKEAMKLAASKLPIKTRFVSVESAAQGVAR